MDHKIINAVSSNRVPAWGNQKKYIAIHYLGVDGQGHDLQPDGCGAHYYIYWDGTIYQRCSHDAIPWAVGTAGYYTQKHPVARNSNTISIEMCCHNTGGDAKSAEDKHWWFTRETQEACAWLVAKLMLELNIPIGNVLRHYDIVNKTCPAPYVHNNKYKESWTWSEFKTQAQNYYQTAKSPVYKVGKKYRMTTSLTLRTEPRADAPLVMYKDIPEDRRKYFKEGSKGQALIKKTVVDKCLGEHQVGSRGVYMRIMRGWILARYLGKDRVKDV